MGRTHRERKQRQRLASEQEQTKNDCFLPGLYKYLNSLGWKNETKLTARNYPITGRGLCSKLAITKDDTIIRLPIKALITIKTIENDESFKNLFNVEKFNKACEISFQSLMAFYMLHQKSIPIETKYEPYIKSLPSYFTTPYFCPVAELQCLPESILERTVEQNRKIKESYKILKEVCACSDFESRYTLSEFRWSYFVVNTRSVYVQAKQLLPDKSFFRPLISDNFNLALAPFLDLFNHSDKFKTQAYLLQNHDTQEFQFVLSLEECPFEKISPYQQVFISYGGLTNLKLLVEYGFILPSNLNDYFEFSLSDIENFIQHEKSFRGQNFHKNKFKFIREHNLYAEMFVHKEDGISHNLHVVLHLLLKEENHFSNILNQVAFGSFDNLLNIDFEMKLLIKFKIVEYEKFIALLEKIPRLSKSGCVSKFYLQESLQYLNTCLLNLEIS